LLAEASQPADVGAGSLGDNEVFLERFGVDGVSLGLPTQVNSIGAGQHTQPALAIVKHDAAFVSWTTSGGTSEVWGRVLDAAGTPLFGGVTCDANDFPLSSLGGARQSGSSLAGADTIVLSTFGDDATAPGGTDSLGLSVHARRFDLAHLFPALR
jgi:hypothetical protein